MSAVLQGEAVLYCTVLYCTVQVTEQRPLLRLDLDLATVTSDCDPSGPR